MAQQIEFNAAGIISGRVSKAGHGAMDTLVERTRTTLKALKNKDVEFTAELQQSAAQLCSDLLERIKHLEADCHAMQPASETIFCLESLLAMAEGEEVTIGGHVFRLNSKGPDDMAQARIRAIELLRAESERFRHAYLRSLGRLLQEVGAKLQKDA